jgi:hypothetical protein
VEAERAGVRAPIRGGELVRADPAGDLAVEFVDDGGDGAGRDRGRWSFDACWLPGLPRGWSAGLAFSRGRDW